MNVFLEKKISIEELFLISMCQVKERKEIITILKIWEDKVGQGMKELIQKTIADIGKLTDDELEEVLNYPLEEDIDE